MSTKYPEFKYIILIGNVKDGFRAYGPYESLETVTSDDDILVEDVADMLTHLTDPPDMVHVMPLYPAKSAEQEEKERFGIFDE